MASERERLVHRIADLEADLASLVSETAFYSGSGKIGKDPLPEAIVSIKGEIARCKAELDRVNASGPKGEKGEARKVQVFDITWAGDRILQVTRSSVPQHQYEFITSPDRTRLEQLYLTSPVDVTTGDPLDDAQRFEDDARKAAREYLRLQTDS